MSPIEESKAQSHREMMENKENLSPELKESPVEDNKNQSPGDYSQSPLHLEEKEINVRPQKQIQLEEVKFEVDINTIE